MTKQEQMFKHVEAWKNSNLSFKSYCIDNGIPQAKLYYWRRKYDKELELSIPKSKKEESTFIPLDIKIPEIISDSFVVTYPNGISLTLPLGTNIDIIQSLTKL